MLNTLYEKQNRPPTRDPDRIAIHNDVTLFVQCPDLDAAYTHLRQRGVDAQPPVNRDYGMTQLTINDPHGYCLCFQHPVT
jgi:hypothetical protein